MPSARAFLRAPGAFSSRWPAFSGPSSSSGSARSRWRSSRVRFFVFPHDRVVSRHARRRLLAQELGHPVEIAALTTGWDGWNPKLVVAGLPRARSRARPTRRRSLDLPEVALDRLVDLGAAARAAAEGARHRAAAARHPPQSRRHLAASPASSSIRRRRKDDSPLTDWILRQREIVVRDALITWDDDLRNAPQLVLDRVQFRLENRFGRHRFGLKGTPPAELAAPIDVRGDLRDVSLQGLAARARDGCSCASTTPTSRRGANGCRCRSRSRAARARCASGSSSPTASRARSSPISSSPTSRRSSATSFPSSTSRICRAAPAGARRDAATRALHAGARLHDASTASGSTRPNFTLTLRDGPATASGSGQIEFDRLQLEPLVAVARAPAAAERDPRRSRALRAARDADATGACAGRARPTRRRRFAASGRVHEPRRRRAGRAPRRHRPLGPLQHRRRTAARSGVTSNGAVLDLPRVFEAPIAFDELAERRQMGAARRQDRRCRVEQFEFANADVGGQRVGNLSHDARRGPAKSTSSRKCRASMRGRSMLPAASDRRCRRGAGCARRSRPASAADARLKLAGNLARFPFANGKGGQVPRARRRRRA